VSPEVADGGTIALVVEGDRIAISVPNRSIVLHVPAAELERRRAMMLARGANPWRPKDDRQRKVSTALQAYAALTMSAARAAVRDLSRVASDGA
jgi:dihydroxy-acid dehydratase